MKSDHHMHTPLCQHAEGWPRDYAARAVELGMQEIGFADHNPFVEPFDDWRMDWADLPRYEECVEEARVAFPHLTIRLGLECDFIAGKERDIEQLRNRGTFDYLIGSVHYVAPGWDVDNPKWIGRLVEHGIEETWRLYQKAYIEAIHSGLFDFMGHPDLPKKFGHRPPGNLDWFYEPIVTALAAKGLPFEINTAGLRKDCQEIYPAPAFLKMAYAAGVPLLINSDAHQPSEVGFAHAEATAEARKAGYTTHLVPTTNGLEPRPLATNATDS